MADSPAVVGCDNQYDGFKLSGGSHATTIDRVDPTTITPSQIFEKYVAARRPVVFTKPLEAVDHRFPGADDAVGVLLKEAANDRVKIEHRSDSHSMYGQGRAKTMDFGSFADGLAKGDDKHYLTTQDLDPDGGSDVPRLMAAPIYRLYEAGNLPLNPSLFPTLVLSSINIWIGGLLKGQSSSSGLHHDFHDNLYLLLRGRKRFRLYSPNDAEKMYTQGYLVKVHPNGRINYEGYETAADGRIESHHDHMANQGSAEECRAALEAKIADAEIALENATHAKDKKRIAEAEKKLESLMDALMDADPGDPSEADEDIEDNEEFEDDDAQIDDKDDDESYFQDPLPPSFSTIPSQMLDKSVAVHADYALYKEATQTFCDVKAGEMLYMPAGWFHEVTSFGDESTTGKDNVSEHWAINWWFHPPDCQDFENPYTNTYARMQFDASLKLLKESSGS